MLRAVEACKEGMSVRQAVRLYKVPRSTLADRVNGRVTHGAVSGPGQLLSKSDELSLVRYCQYMASHGHPLTKSQCSAFGTSIRRERDPNAQPLSRTWWRNFRQRHHLDLTMRTPEIIDRVAKVNFARVLSGPYERCKARSSVPPPPVPPRPRIHPLVASGDISADLAEILMECDYKKKTTCRLPVAARVITGEEFQQLFREREEKEQAAAALKEQRAQLRRTKMEQLAQRQRAAVAAASPFTAAESRTTSGTVARPPRSREAHLMPSSSGEPALARPMTPPSGNYDLD
ncbi:hypothetical protein SKAU_G00412290 [Synaphobranchus kaupii]|uniref:HTH psq-type domain-containing protein n=1 Tax=Synaphobranchus kaupii TaxID=118154 RepID=A0A9Q1E7Z0_SYNKA|nr:hypothetical protein SKAU_G00412240 [Synaphobranchus kaupii]KAJ8333910.1 hypothetical protein SKAU_G00412290 [Synaphobranchus kaupii]